MYQKEMYTYINNKQMMSSFDLNIQNYKKDELVDMFDLPSIYDKEILEEQENKLRKSIENNNKISPDIKTKTIQFLNEAKKILIDDLVEGVINIKKSIESFYKSNNQVKKVPVNDQFEVKEVEINDQYGHMVQERKPMPYKVSYPSEFFPGVINPLKKRITRQNLNIDTRFRENYYNTQSTNYNIDLPIKFSGIVTIQLTAMELPNSFYVISKQLGNNFFTITIPTDSTTTDSTSNSSQSQTYYVQDGNYTAQDLLKYLNSILQNQNQSNNQKFQYLLFSINEISSSNSGSGNIILGIDSTKTSDLFIFTLDFQADKYGSEDRNTPLPLKFGWLLGFRNGQYTNNYSYVSEGIIDLSGPKYAYLVIDDFNNNVNNSFYSAFNSSLLNKNILARISLQSIGNFNTNSENNLSLITYARQYFGPVDIQKINVQLLDEYGRIMDLNNMDYSFCLTLLSTYDL